MKEKFCDDAMEKEEKWREKYAVKRADLTINPLTY